MAAFLGISLWIALATVVPGLVTIAVLYGGVAVGSPSLFASDFPTVAALGEWVYGGVAITVMVLTQALGILLEGALVRNQWLGPAQCEIKIPQGIDPLGVTHFSLEPYAEYQGLYLLLAELRENEDTQGHLQRALAQFFLTNNTMISFTAGIVTTLLVMSLAQDANVAMALTYVAILSACLLVSYAVARIRFEVMAKALWAARRRRIEPIAEPAPEAPIYIEI